MTELAVQDPNITRLMQIEEMFRTDPMLLRNYLIQERAHQDYMANLEHTRAESEAHGFRRGRDEGERLGIRRGRDEALLATARRMKAMGLPDTQIAQATGLPLADIEAL